MPDPYDPKDATIRNYSFYRQHLFLSQWFNKLKIKKRSSVVEAGGGGSRWLPYLANEFDFKVSALDYSDNGCLMSEAILEKSHVRGRVLKADLLKLPRSEMDKYDLVFSWGLIEHFTPTTKIVEPLVNLAKNKGYVFTILPNMNGLVGWLQRKLDSNVYDIHVPLTLNDVVAAHKDCGLRVLHAAYFQTINLGVVNAERHCGTFFYTFWRYFRNLVMVPVWWLEKHGLSMSPNPYTSPYIVCIAQK